MAEAFIDGILTMVGIIFLIVSQVLLYNCGDANYNEKGIFAEGYAITIAIGLAFTIGGVGGYVASL